MQHIYIKPVKKAVIIAKKQVTIKDIADLQGPQKLLDKIYQLVVMEIDSKKDKNYLISCLDIVTIIQNEFHDLLIQNYGEIDTIISYQNSSEKDNKIWVFLKILSVCFILFCGGAVAIMTFHTDAAVPDIFLQVYKIFMGTDEKSYLIEISYSIGLAAGIIVFFNHFSNIKLTQDPTPIEVEMRSYEMQVEDSIIESLLNEKENQDDSH